MTDKTNAPHIHMAFVACERNNKDNHSFQVLGASGDTVYAESERHYLAESQPGQSLRGAVLNPALAKAINDWYAAGKPLSNCALVEDNIGSVPMLPKSLSGSRAGPQ